MPSKWISILAAFVTTCVVNLVGIYFIFQPVAQADDAAMLSLPPIIGFLIYIVLCTALLHWATQHLRSAYKAAFIIGTSQFILVNVDYVLIGQRGIMTAAASTLVLATTWFLAACAYTHFIQWNND
tara:strand:+ start:167 stop:544 length:378 start_codon:yes stop_codon:yes gene_type:complete